MRHFPLLSLAAASLLAADLTLDTLSVTDSRIERPTSQVPQAVDVISAQAIENLKMTNISQALKGNPGVLAESKNSGYDVRLVIRGAGLKAPYGVREIMVLRDGVPMTDPDSFTRFDFVDLEDVKSIEIVKGPGSLYSAGSYGGTIHIRSKSVFEKRQDRIKVGVGNYGSYAFNGRISGNFNEKDYWAFSLSHRNSDNDWRRWNEFKTTQASFKYGHIFDSGATLESEIAYTKADLQIPGTMNQSQFETFRATGEQKETNVPWKHSGRYSKILFFNSRYEQEVGQITFKPRLYFTHWEHYHPVTGVIKDATSNNVVGTDLELLYAHTTAGAKGSLVTGMTVRYDKSDDSKSYAYKDTETQNGRIKATLSDVKGNLLSISDETALLYGIYLQENLNWERVTLDIGGSLFKSRFESSSIEYGKYDYAKGKYDYNTSIYPNQDLYTQDYTFFSPKIQAGYALAKGVNLYASLSRAQQTPSQSEINANKTYGKPDLKAATATNYEIGLKSRSKRHSLDLALYVMPIKDEIIQIYNTTGSYYANAGKTNKKGLELSASYSVTDELTIGGNYAYSNYTYDQFTESNSSGSFVRDGNHLPYIPKHQYTLMANWISPTGFKATLRSTTWGKYYVDNANSATYTPPTFITDLLVGYSKDHHDFSLNIANILDKHYASEVKKDMRTGALSYSAAPVRTIMAHYSYKF